VTTSGQDRERRLATIVAADIFGYSRLMDADEEGTYSALRAARTEVIDPKIEEHKGRIVKHTGDGFLAEFPTVLAAVQFALAMQEEIGALVKDIPEDRRIRFRIGINLGDIIVDDDGDIFGDGVNVAAGLESLGIPGGICISEPVYKSVHKRLDIDFDDLGDQSVKNISTPVHAYDVRWEGEAGTPHDRVVKPISKRRRVAVIAGALVLACALGFIAVDKLGLGTNAAPGINEAKIEKSIAVLPFVNTSNDTSNEYFSDGLAEELLNLLAKMPELRVAARTSSFSYKGRDVRIAQIGEELNVSHVLEGSVRKAGNQLRITVQLIQAEDGYNLWSERYDRRLDDIFAIQDEIASEVVAQLKIRLLNGVPTVKETDPEAYALYLQARHLSRQDTPLAYEQSISLYQQALEVDPDYAASWDGLATIYYNQAGSGLRPVDEGYRLAREAANRALAIDRAHAPAHASLGWIARDYDGDLAAAARHFERALELDPANTAILSAAARLAISLGRLDEAISVLENVVDRDPVNAVGHHSLSLTYRWAGRLDEAIASGHTALSLSPGRIGTKYLVGVALLLRGAPEAALAAIAQESLEPWRLTGLVMVYHALGQASESDLALAELIDKYEQGRAYNIAYVLAFRGEVDRTFEWLDKAVQHKDPGLSQIHSQNLFSNIHDDPRWLPFLESIGKSPEQLAAIKFEVTLPE
jgi:TolB-like protein/class 3 adenylate cyclase/Tfp pilus assembly protein PilF